MKVKELYTMNFNDACEKLSEQTDLITTYESLKDFAIHNVAQHVNTKVLAIENGGKCVKALNTQDNTEISIDCDMVVMAAGSVKNVLDVEGVTAPVYYAGDCSGERTAGISEAIRSGYKAANEI